MISISSSFEGSIDYMRFLAFKALKDLYKLEDLTLEVHYTKKEFIGDVTLVIFPLAKILKKSLNEIAQQIASYIVKESPFIENHECIGGFLNISFNDAYYFELAKKINQKKAFDLKSTPSISFMVEYSSPNTNKPLHLGHIRNNLLGYSLSKLFKYAGNKVIQTQLINDRGIHICKSMIAWKKFSNGETPKTAQVKGDHFVGKYYVLFDKILKEQIKELTNKGYDSKDAYNQAPILKEAREYLIKWEEEDADIHALWNEMNTWVYSGFNQTYDSLGIKFDQTQYESQTYLLGKKIIEEGLKKNIFYKKEDGSIWVDLKEEGLDEKILLRSDGTSVYITQDLGTVLKRFEEQKIEKLIYVVGEEQEYHFKVLFAILKKLGYKWADDGLYHLSYGMVNLPTGKMKSREGTVVDADMLIEQMYEKAKEITQELGKLESLSLIEKDKLFKIIGMGALKYYLLKVDPKKGILFDPNASIDFKGNTAPYIQYTYARICSLERKIKELNYHLIDPKKERKLSLQEKNLLKIIEQHKDVIHQAVIQLDISKIANYAYDIAKLFNDFYQHIPLLNKEDKTVDSFKLNITLNAARMLENTMDILGIELPKQM